MSMKRNVFRAFANASTVLYINTWKTRNEPWNVALEIHGNDISMFSADKNTIEFLSLLQDAVLRLPVDVSVPETFNATSLPRYYAIYCTWTEKKDTFTIENVKIIEIVGVHRDLSPTKWSYRLGYWHPACQFDIADALWREIREIKKILQEEEEKKIKVEEEAQEKAAQ